MNQPSASYEHLVTDDPSQAEDLHFCSGVQHQVVDAKELIEEKYEHQAFRIMESHGWLAFFVGEHYRYVEAREIVSRAASSYGMHSTLPFSVYLTHYTVQELLWEAATSPHDWLRDCPSWTVGSLSPYLVATNVVGHC